MGFEGGVFSAAAYLMGLISADAVAAHAVALQIAALSFMVPWGMAQAATVRVGLALGAQRPRRDRPRRAGAPGRMGTGFMALMAVVIWLFPRELITLFLDDSAANADVIALGRGVPRRRRHLPDRRRRAGRRRRHAARAPRHPRADDLHLRRLLAGRASASAYGSPSAPAGAGSASGPGSRSGWRSSRC